VLEGRPLLVAMPLCPFDPEHAGPQLELFSSGFLVFSLRHR
jgi:hypothetical protein